MTIAEDFNLRRELLERFIGDRLVSLVIYSAEKNAADTLDRVVEERRRIMMEINLAFGFIKGTPA